MFSPNTDITDVLQAEIDATAAAGGGEIIIPSGLYHIRSVQLKSHICLRLSAGARLLASGKKEDYAPIGYNHNEMGDVHAVLYALDQEHVKICGEGEIDLNCWAFYEAENPDSIDTVGPEVTQAHLDEASRSYDWRINQPIFFHQCTHVHMDGVQVRNASCWTITCNFCQTVKMTNLTIENPLTIPNSDGIHFCGSEDIIIRGCHITAGDDCIALSSITDWNRACENVTISDCVFQSGSKAISIGYMHSIVRNVLIENIIVKKSNRAYVTMCHPRTGLVENVRVHNCILEGRSYGGDWWGNGESIVIMVTPHDIEWYRDDMPADRFDVSVRNIEFSGVTCLCERPVAFVANDDLCRNVRLVDSVVHIVAEEKPSLKGNVVDLAPGPENFQITEENIGVVSQNVQVEIRNVTDADGLAVKQQES
ncbi:MAG: right-handed parallel beta-helix repeat-containing protein [Planctomycetes bacterium]|nr:right-handed parallel beta-helix repeat-containing protein [Planctomycetota bacterium]